LTEKQVRFGAVLIVALFGLLSGIYSVVVPPFEASDELWHYPMVKYIADHWRLPVQEPGVETAWRQEGSQPPLYYALGAAATFWIDTSNMATVRHVNPHADGGVVTPDGNVNLVVPRPARERFPWRGTVLAVHLIRFLSVGMGMAAVYLTYRIGREVFPDRPVLALGSAAIHAFTPMFAFISGSVNNDNLAVTLCSLTLLMLIRIVCGKATVALCGSRIAYCLSSIVRCWLIILYQGSSNADHWRIGCLLQVMRRLAWIAGRLTRVARRGARALDYVALGIVLGLTALTKLGWPALALLTALVVAIRAARRRSWRHFVMGGVATLLPLMLIAGWWYLRNWTLYGDPLGLNVFKLILGTRAVPADLAQLWRERHSFVAGYWGNFGGLNVPMPAWIYTILNLVTLLAAFGLVRTAVVRFIALIRHRHPGTPANQYTGPPVYRYTSIPVYRSTNLPALLCILWGAGVVLPWALSWARDTWSSQGRLIFSAISTWSLLLAWGVASWWPRRWQKWALGGLAAFLLALTAAAPWVWIRPAYALPEPLTEAQVEAIPHQLRVDFGLPGAEIPVMRLLGYGLEQDVVQPGGEAAVTLYWETVASADKDYTVFVHLVDDLNMVVAQRDTYPGLGTLSTQWLTPGFRWRDRYVLRVPETAYAPNAARTEARIEVGLYDRVTGMRLETGTAPALETGVDENILGDHVAFGRIAIKPRPGEYPNPTFVNLGDRMALVGYDLDRRAARPGETVTLTLYWRGLRTMETSYTVSVQLIDHAQRKAAQHDGPPLGGEAPTSTWEPGQTLVDPYHLKIAPDASPGVYRVQVVVYTFDEDGEIAPLPTVPEGGEMQARQVTLTTVRVSE